MHIETPRFLLRDFSEADRQSFIDYQMDPRYQGLYDSVEAGRRATTLFDLFGAWRQQNPRQNFQVGIFERKSSRLCGCAGLRQAGKPEGTAVFGLELTPNDWGRYGVAIEVACALLEYGFHALRLHTHNVAACGHFATVLGPEANEGHRNHFHLDWAARRPV